MREYLDAAAAYGLCLESQVKLGAELVTVSGKLLNDQTPAETAACRFELHRLCALLRRGRTELKRLRRAANKRKAAIL